MTFRLFRESNVCLCYCKVPKYSNRSEQTVQSLDLDDTATDHAEAV